MPSGPDCRLVGLEIENLRGFTKTTLSLKREVTLLVGPNNSGKTSLLRLLDWGINGADEDLLHGRRRLNERELALLVPARDTRGSGRRLVLKVEIADGRTARRFDAIDRVTRLRFRIVGESVFLAVTRPRRSEPRRSEPAALELLKALRARTPLVLVPSSRSAESERFEKTLGTAVRAKLEERALHAQRGGAPAEYRKVKAVLGELETVASDLVSPLWTQMQLALVPGLAKVGDFSLQTSAEDLIDWLVSQIEFVISTGAHDERKVRPGEVGSGLQSLLDLAVIRTAEGQGDPTWLLIEEPEAFLHPSAQRSVATALREASDIKRIVSTHSPLVAEEAEYGEVALVRDHRVFEPQIVEARRAEINTAFQTGAGAEALFARSVLLVEGPGDRAFFEALRRRLSIADPSGRVNTLMAVDVGGKTRFGPWIRLLRSYANDGELPVRWIAVADSADATTDVAAGARDGGVVIPASISQLLARIGQHFERGQEEEAIVASSELNAMSLATGFRVALAPVDLEYMMLAAASPATCRSLSERIRHTAMDRRELLRVLGSRYGAGPISNPMKAPWIRALIGQNLPAAEFSEDAVRVLRLWMGGAIEDEVDVSSVIDGLE